MSNAEKIALLKMKVKVNFKKIHVAAAPHKQQVGFPTNPPGNDVSFVFACNRCKWALNNANDFKKV